MKKIDLTIFNEFRDVLIESLPKIAGILAFVIISWLVLKLVLMLFKRILKFSKIEVINNKLNEIDLFESAGFKINISKIILFFIKWILILSFLILGADIFGLQKVSDEVGNIIAFLPTLFSAILIFLLESFWHPTPRNPLKIFEIFRVGRK